MPTTRQLYGEEAEGSEECGGVKSRVHREGFVGRTIQDFGHCPAAAIRMVEFIERPDLKRLSFIRGHWDGLAALGQFILQPDGEETGEHFEDYRPQICVLIERTASFLQKRDRVSLREKLFEKDGA